ncbi:hypothetical protein P3T18_003179 [Paraburkholderia sp. GAS199]
MEAGLVFIVYLLRGYDVATLRQCAKWCIYRNNRLRVGWQEWDDTGIRGGVPGVRQVGRVCVDLSIRCGEKALTVVAYSTSAGIAKKQASYMSRLISRP